MFHSKKMNRNYRSVPRLVRSVGVILIVIIMNATTSYSATYYVSTAGSDSNAGTLALPFRTIVRGVSSLVAGDTLYIRAGTYAERIDSNNMTIPTGTSWSNTVTIAAYPGESVTLKPNSGSPLNLAHSYIQYLVIDGLIVDAVNTGTGENGLSIVNNANHIRIKNTEIKNAFNQGIQTVFGSDYNEFINLNVHDNGRGETTTSNEMHGIYLGSANNLLDGGSYHHNAAYGIQLYSGYGSYVNNNVVRNIRVFNNQRGPRAGSSKGGIIVYTGTNNLLYNLIIYDNNGGGGGNGIIIGGGATNTLLYNSTIYNHAEYSVIIERGSGHVIKNNILYLNSYGGVADSPGSTLSNNLTTDPKFVNAVGNDFHLQSTSAAINSGTTLSQIPIDFDNNSRPQGSGYDIGAYEYTSGSGGATLAAPSSLVVSP